jgi:hypothetical protein
MELPWRACLVSVQAGAIPRPKQTSRRASGHWASPARLSAVAAVTAPEKKDFAERRSLRKGESVSPRRCVLPCGARLPVPSQTLVGRFHVPFYAGAIRFGKLSIEVGNIYRSGYLSAPRQGITPGRLAKRHPPLPLSPAVLAAKPPTLGGRHCIIGRKSSSGQHGLQVIFQKRCRRFRYCQRRREPAPVPHACRSSTARHESGRFCCVYQRRRRSETAVAIYHRRATRRPV